MGTSILTFNFMENGTVLSEGDGKEQKYGTFAESYRILLTQ
jgi:hypothetical protein